ncbi:GNAT family N-acetyltransferase [Alkalihalobacillus sp. AL-G]|uniref:GNAT family N-acetyltransferase n=1 Tax=Alkalihalobacillus sp. AL-G TaxID=2926399 RepID=UPI00272C8758|nr:GNAT family N-acetyltransferase [Alkalihalobacillus sp. AL-G]WLD92309.1 GNAT family N-acetyltransferase [Alkalihalobacillus sp. AL-G]
MERKMTGLTFYKDYKNNEKLRKSFNELATLIFGINFEDWYQKGYWNNRYIPFSYTDGDKVIANVSVNLLEFVINGEKKRAIQIGTVMTHPDYRDRGLSASLMNKVLEEYENKYDFMYLFANQSVLEFYPKFGFKPVKEYQFSMEYSTSQNGVTGIRKLDGSNIDDLKFIYELALERVPVSKRFGTDNTQGLLMFYCIYVFNNDIYYLEDEEAIVIFEQEDGQVDIFDMVSKKAVNIDKILSKISHYDINKIVFHYTPDYQGIKTQRYIFNGDDVLFVKISGNNEFPLFQVKHPLTSQA